MAWFQKKDQALNDYQNTQVTDQALAAQDDKTRQGFQNFDQITTDAMLRMSDAQWEQLNKKLSKKW